MKLLLIGDIVGKPGRQIVVQCVRGLVLERGLDLVVANAENAAGGSGLTPSIDFTLSRWALALGCTGLGTTSDDGSLRIVDYTGCRGGVPFQTIYINGQGHAWPGGNGLNELVLGPDTGALNATDTIWSFFAANGAK